MFTKLPAVLKENCEDTVTAFLAELLEWLPMEDVFSAVDFTAKELNQPALYDRFNDAIGEYLVRR